MNPNVKDVVATDQEISFKEASKYIGVAMLMRDAYEAANKTANTYANLPCKKTLKGLMDFAEIASFGVADLTQEGRRVVLREIKNVYSKKLAEKN